MTSPSWTFLKYISQRLLASAAVASSACLLLFYVVNILELLRRLPPNSDVTFPFLLTLASLQLPSLFEEALPFLVLLTSLICFINLSRSQELTVMRTSGFSVWQFTAPLLLTMVILPSVLIIAIQPLAAALSLSYKTQYNIHLRQHAPTISFLANGLWLYDVTENEYKIIHTESVHLHQNLFEGITFFLFQEGNHFKERLEAETATLTQGQWQIRNARLFNPKGEVLSLPRERLSSSLSVEDIQERFLAPRTISFWNLPHFIKITEKTGLSTTPFYLYLYTLLLLPFLLCGHALIGFALALYNRHISVIAIAGLLMIGILFFLTSLCTSLALSGDLSPLNATFIPAILSICLGIFLLHYREYG